MSSVVLARIEGLQHELEALKKAVALQEHVSTRRQVEIKGLWKGIRVSDEDVEEAQRSTFKEAYRVERHA